MDVKKQRWSLWLFAAVLLLRLLAPAETEALRDLLLGSAGRQAVEAACFSLWDAADADVVAVFGETQP